jgi:hypothetical protein
MEHLDEIGWRALHSMEFQIQTVENKGEIKEDSGKRARAVQTL